MKVKQFTTDLLSYGFNDVFTKILSLLVLPIIIRRLTVGEFGVVEAMLNTTALIPLFIGVGYDIALKKQIMINKSKDYGKIENAIKTVIVFLIVWGALLTGSLVLFGESIAMVITGDITNIYAVIYAIVGVYFGSFIDFIQTLNRAKFNLKSYTRINVLRYALIYGSVIIALSLPLNSIEAYFLAILGVNVSIALLLIYKNSYIFNGTVSLLILKEIIAFGFPAMIAGLGYWVYQLSDRIILMNITNAEQVGLYSMGVKIVSINAFIVKAFQNAWIPRAFELYNDNVDDFISTVISLKKYVTIIFSILSLGVFAISEMLIFIIAGSTFGEAYIFVAPLALAYLFYALSHVSSISLYVNDKTKYIAYVNWGAAILNISINLVFIPVFGSITASMSTLISYLFVYIMYSFFSNKYFDMNKKDKSAIIIPLAVIMIIFQYFVQLESIILNTSIRLLVTLVFILVLIIFKIIEIKKIYIFIGGIINDKKRN